jgi:ABC-2 type transport system permease protein
MTGLWKYTKLLGQLGRYTLARELAFRTNFLVKVSVEALWLAILLAFYQTVFGKTPLVAGWSQNQYLFFVGCFFALNGMIECLFLENCNEFAELVRTGDLDFLLLKPIDEQFLISCRRVDWATAPNVLMGAGVMLFALIRLHWQFDPLKLVAFFATFGCGVLIAYAFMLTLTAFSVWLVRNQSLMEMWWLFASLARYPRQIFDGTNVAPLGFVFSFILPILLVANVPSDVMVRVFDWRMIVFMFVATAVSLIASRRFFQHALRSYRSASS